MKLLVGIPTHKRPELLRKCLDSIAAQRGALPEIEVFIADNDAAGREGVNLVEQMAPGFPYPLAGAVVAQPGISAVRNAILDEAKRRGVDFIAMIDDDETASPEWLVNLLAMQRETSADIVGGPVQFRFAFQPSQEVVDSRTFRTATRPPGKTFPLWGTANFVVSAPSLAKADWPKFDDEFGLSGGEDTEWFKRLCNLGLLVAWAPNALTIEEVGADRATREWILRRAYRCGNSDLRVAMKFWPSSDLPKSLWKLALTVGSAPILAPLLLVPRRRLWLLRAWWTAAGAASAIFGGRFNEYAKRHGGHAKTD